MRSASELAARRPIVLKARQQALVLLRVFDTRATASEGPSHAFEMSVRLLGERYD